MLVLSHLKRQSIIDLRTSPAGFLSGTRTSSLVCFCFFHIHLIRQGRVEFSMKYTYIGYFKFKENFICWFENIWFIKLNRIKSNTCSRSFSHTHGPERAIKKAWVCFYDLYRVFKSQRDSWDSMWREMEKCLDGWVCFWVPLKAHTCPQRLRIFYKSFLGGVSLIFEVRENNFIY